MSITHTATAAASGEIRQPGIFSRAAHRVFAVISRKAATAVERIAATGRDVPQEVYRFPLF